MRKLLAFTVLCLLTMGLAAQEFKVGTYNLFTSDSRKKVIEKDSTVSHQRYWCNSAQAVAKMISELDCDILGVQEVCDSIWGLKGDKDVRKLVADQGKTDYEWILYPTPERVRFHTMSP